MVKEDLNNLFSNDVYVRGVQNFDTLSISLVISFLLLLFLLVGTMWVMGVKMNTGGYMVDCISNAISFFIMCVML